MLLAWGPQELIDAYLSEKLEALALWSLVGGEELV